MSRLTPGSILKLVFGLTLCFAGPLSVHCVAQDETGDTQESNVREWVDNTGEHKIVAEFIEVRDVQNKDGSATAKAFMRRADNGKVIAVPLSRLCEADQKLIKELANPDGTSDQPMPEQPTPDEGKNPDPIVPNPPPIQQRQPDNPPADEEPADKKPAARKRPPMNVPRFNPKSNPPSTPKKQPEENTAPTPTDPVVETPAETPATEDMTTAATSGNDANGSNENDGIDEPGAEGSLPSAVLPFRRSEKNLSGKTNDTAQPNPRTSRPGEISTAANEPTSDFRPSANSDDSTSPPPIVARSKPENPSEPIDAGLVSVQPQAAASWSSFSDQQLIDSIDLSASLQWKGRFGVTHQLDPIAPNFELMFTLRDAEFLDAITQIGFVTIDSFIDEEEFDHKPLALPPRIPNPTKGWVEPNRGLAVGGQSPVFVGVEFPRTRMTPKNVVLQNGSLKVRLAEQLKRVTVQNVSTATGSIQNTDVQDKGIQISLSQPDESTIVATVTGDSGQVLSMQLDGIQQNQYGAGKMKIGSTSYFQFNFVGAIPAGLNLGILMIEQDREIVIPFSFEKIQFNSEAR